MRNPEIFLSGTRARATLACAHVRACLCGLRAWVHGTCRSHPMVRPSVAEAQRRMACHAIKVVLSVGAAVVGALVSPALVGAALPRSLQSNRPDDLAAPTGSGLNQTPTAMQLPVE